MFDNGSVAQIEALCEDNFKRCFIGVKRFLSYDNFKDIIVSQGLSFTKYREQNEFEMNTDDELILCSKIDWVEMIHVVERVHVFFCNEEDFLQRKINMGLSIDTDFDMSFQQLKFCHRQWTGDRLESVI